MGDESKKSSVQTAIEVVNLFNLAAPGIASLILLIRREDGTVVLMPILDEADAGFSANIKQAQDWLASHRGTP